jgi:L-methionine (R)-S-oxide reductase
MPAAASGRSEQELRLLALFSREPREPLDTVLDRMVAALQSGFPHYSGVYIYWLDGAETLVLRAFRGRPTEHKRIPVGSGICGRAARTKQTVVVDDVNADPAYLACSLETRSEIVVPIMWGGQVLGEIDIDSDVPAAFAEGDRRFLEDVAAAIAAHA